MNKLLIIVVLVPGLCLAQGVKFNNPEKISGYLMRLNQPDQPLILAHRGGPGPSDTENSLETFSRTYRQVPNSILEMDVRMSRDSVLTLLHDDELERTTTGNGSLKEKTWEELSNLNLRDLRGKPTGQKMPLFDEVLNWNQNRAVLALDVKPGVDLRKVMKLVADHNAFNSVFVICYTPESAHQLRQTYPDLWLALGVATPDDLDKIRQLGLSFHHIIALCPRKQQSSAFYEGLHRVGMPCSVGTYGKDNLDELPMEQAASAYKSLFKQGADILTTDRPVAVNALFR